MRRAVPYVLFSVVAAAMCLQSFLPPPVVAEAPAVELGEVRGFSSVALEPSLAETETLPRDTVVLKRRYVGALDRSYLVTAVIGGSGKSSIHRPELCLPAQGFLMSEPRDFSASSVPWRGLFLERGVSGEKMAFAYTFFNQNGFRTSSHIGRIFTDVWDRSVHGRIDRWVMVTVLSFSGEESHLRAFLSELSFQPR